MKILFPLLLALALLVIPQPTTVTHAQTPTPCSITAASADRINIRRGPSINDLVAGTLTEDMQEPVNGVHQGADGYRWWRTQGGGWVREDVALTAGDCSNVPPMMPTENYCTYLSPAVRPAISGPTKVQSTPHFAIHFTLSGRDKTTLEMVEAVSEALEQAWAYQIYTLGWPAPPFDCGEGGDARFDVYMMDLDRESILGYTSPDNRITDHPNTPAIERDAAYSHLALDNDYRDYAEPLRVMRATIAHEFHHNIQMGYDFGDSFDGLDEAGATWMETMTFPADESATPYIEDLFNYPDMCVGSESWDAYTRIYAEWLLIDSIAQDYGTDSIITLWENRATYEGMESFYRGLASLGTDAPTTITRMAIRNLLRDYELAPFFPAQVFVEGVVEGVGKVYPRRDGVEQLGVDYVYIATPGFYDFEINQPRLQMILVGIDRTTQRASVFELGAKGSVDTTPFSDAYLLILNPQQHNSPYSCTTANWILAVREGITAVVASDEVWDARNYRLAAQTLGTETYKGLLTNSDNTASFRLLDLQAGDIVTVTAEADGSDIDTFIALYDASGWLDPDGASVISDDDGGQGLNSVFSYEVSYADDYYLLLRIFSGAGSYKLTIDIARGAGSGETIIPDIPAATESIATLTPADGVQEFTGSIALNQELTYTLAGLSAGDVVYVYAEGDTIDPYLIILDPQYGRVYAEDDDSGGGYAAALKFEVLVDGDYLLTLLSLQEMTGPYRLVVGVNTPNVFDAIYD